MDSSPPGRSARLSRTLPVSSAEAFAFFTEPEPLEKWFGRGAMAATVDLRVGGRYRFEFPPGDGPADRLSGEYLEIVPAKRLVITFSVSQPGVRDVEAPTTVSVDFVDRDDDRCEVVLTHRAIETAADQKRKADGWANTFARLLEYADATRRGSSQ